jgi:hypothetical protein
MPNHAKHCEVALRHYGKDFSQLHTWMDFPSITYGVYHRRFRHDPDKTPIEALQLFGSLADQACLDHIILDAKTSDGQECIIPETGTRFKQTLAKLTQYLCRHRPTNEELTEAIGLLIGSGVSAEEIRKIMGISKSTYYKYTQEFRE